MKVNDTTYPDAYPIEVVTLLERERTKPSQYARRLRVTYADGSSQVGYVERSCGAGPAPVKAVGLRFRRGAVGIDLLYSSPPVRIAATAGNRVLWFLNS